MRPNTRTWTDRRPTRLGEVWERGPSPPEPMAPRVLKQIPAVASEHHQTNATCS